MKATRLKRGTGVATDRERKYKYTERSRVGSIESKRARSLCRGIARDRPTAIYFYAIVKRGWNIQGEESDRSVDLPIVEPAYES